jgi:hypothetical protein
MAAARAYPAGQPGSSPESHCLIGDAGASANTMLLQGYEGATIDRVITLATD